MTIMATKFTPEVMLSAPRRSAAVPNSTGKLALFTVSEYSFESHAKSYAIKVLDIASGSSTVLYENPSYTEPTWISENEFIFIDNAGPKNGNAACSLMVADATKPGKNPLEISSFKGTIANLKAKPLKDGSVAFGCTALTTRDGDMYDPTAQKKPLSSARVYTGLFARHWDTWCGKERSAVFYGALAKQQQQQQQQESSSLSSGRSSNSSSSSWTLQEPGLVNALAGTRLECPVPTFGGAGDYDLGPKGLVFVSKDPDLNPALWTKTDLYYVPLATFTEARPPRPQQVKTGALQGYTGAPAFSHDGARLAFKRMRHRQYEADKWRLLLIPDVEDLSAVQEFYPTPDGEGAWDRSPEDVVWRPDDGELFVTAEHRGRQLLFRLPPTPLLAKELPRPVTRQGVVAGVYNLPGDRLFVCSSSLVDSSAYSVLDTATGDLRLVSSGSKQGKSFGLSPQQVDEIWFPGGGGGGGGDYRCHALVMRPSGFDESKKYPLAFLIHGGPQGAWTDGWSTRWNPAVLAEQGYVVVAPNPTGSTGYGQAFVDAIARDWGGRPYRDLENCFEYIEKNMAYVDTGNAVALGASYGGYMINWIQGHPLGRKFRALVCHDGIFSTLADWATEELFFVVHDMGGTPWAQRERYARWDPSAFVGAWQTPQLVVHSELDYRLPVSEGLAAFNALQTRGVDSRLLVFPDENHWVLKPENSLVWHKEVLGWINKYTGLDTTGLAGEVEDLSLK
ncbi:prolyl oligopeptidase [Xylariomycetidae sp. FL0641]|nr:prolyl oligopeptidase [Xylariomycetidae sp. FL0641]